MCSCEMSFDLFRVSYSCGMKTENYTRISEVYSLFIQHMYRSATDIQKINQLINNCM